MSVCSKISGSIRPSHGDKQTSARRISSHYISLHVRMTLPAYWVRWRRINRKQNNQLIFSPHSQAATTPLWGDSMTYLKRQTALVQWLVGLESPLFHRLLDHVLQR